MPRNANITNDALERLTELLERQSHHIEVQAQQLERLMMQGAPRNQDMVAPNGQCMERFQRLRPPVFDGQSTDPIVAEEWIRTMEDMMTYAKIEDREKVTCATFHFALDARFWWDTIKTSMDVTAMSWDKFKVVFFDKYFSRTMRTSKMVEFTQ
ncbi:hypothetical protein AJ87_00070 [Rhizobium yanglingense]|nr:hypothetical protein AJ87_00070 [Rhizobium yanglingense]